LIPVRFFYNLDENHTGPRNFAGYIKRCEEIVSNLNWIEEEIKKFPKNKLKSCDDYK